MIVAAMTTPSCSDSKKSASAETAKKPGTAETANKPGTAQTANKPATACDCIKKMTQVVKDIKKLSLEETGKIGDMEAYMNKKLFDGNDCERIMEENDKKYPTPESMEKDCPAVRELMSIMEEFNAAGNSSPPEAEMPEGY